MLDLQPNRPHELEDFEHDGVGHLRFLDDVAEDRLRILGLGKLALEDPRHDLDAGERILDLVRDGGGHLAERRQPVAQPLALLELLDPRQVLEEERGPRHPPARILHLRDRVADDFVRALQPQLGAIREVRQVERPGDDARHFRPALEHAREGPPDVGPARRESQNAVGDIVHDGDRAVDGDRQDTVAQAPDQVAVEVLGRDARGRSRRPTAACGPWRAVARERAADDWRRAPRGFRVGKAGSAPRLA